MLLWGFRNYLRGREHVKPVLRAFLHAKSADLLFFEQPQNTLVNVYNILLLISIWVGLKPATEDQDFKKNRFLRLVYQIDRVFPPLIKDPQTKIPTNAYFGHQRDAKLSHRVLKTIKLPFLVHFWLDWFFLSLETFIRVYYCLRLKEFEIREILLHRLEFTVF